MSKYLQANATKFCCQILAMKVGVNEQVFNQGNVMVSIVYLSLVRWELMWACVVSSWALAFVVYQGVNNIFPD